MTSSRVRSWAPYWISSETIAVPSRARYHGILLEGGQRLRQALRDQAEAVVLHLVERKRVHVLSDVGRAGIELPMDAVEPGRDESGDAEVGVHRTRDEPALEAARLRDAEHLGAVVVAVADEGRRPREPGGRAGQELADRQALVIVHGRRNQ